MELADVLSNALLNTNPAGSQVLGTPRAPISLTSRLRTLTGAAGTSLDNDTRALGIDYYKTSQYMPVINMALNPNSVKFSQPKRYTKKDTLTGSVYFHFTNARGQNNDVLTMAFTGNTGNIDLRGSVGELAPAKVGMQQESASGPTSGAAGGAGADTGALNKLLVWHNLYALTREPMVLADGTENEFYITYISALIPVDVTFIGFFSKVLEFEENAKKPNSRDYSFEFIVRRTVPDLDLLLGELVAQTQAVQRSIDNTVIDSGVRAGTTERDAARAAALARAEQGRISLVDVAGPRGVVRP